MKKVFCTIDTETIGGINNPKCAYHIGGIVHDRQGNYLATFNYLVANLFDCIRDDDYQKKNWGKYQQMVDDGIVTFVSTVDEAVSAVDSLLTYYNVDTVMAFNAAFDLCRGACSPLIENRDFVDLWGMALETLCQRKKYRDFCVANGLKSRSGKTVSTSAEAVYAYLKQNASYVEEHTAFEDSKIELEIYLACIKSHKRFTRGVYCMDLPNRFQLFPKFPKEGA